jgi:hypothetical protein
MLRLLWYRPDCCVGLLVGLEAALYVAASNPTNRIAERAFAAKSTRIVRLDGARADRAYAPDVSERGEDEAGRRGPFPHWRSHGH